MMYMIVLHFRSWSSFFAGLPGGLTVPSTRLIVILVHVCHYMYNVYADLPEQTAIPKKQHIQIVQRELHGLVLLDFMANGVASASAKLLFCSDKEQSNLHRDDGLRFTFPKSQCRTMSHFVPAMRGNSTTWLG